MKYIFSVSLILFFSVNLSFAQVEGKDNQKKVRTIFDNAQVNVFFEASFYILKEGINEQKAKDIAKKINIYKQLKAIKNVSPTAYNCLMLAKFPKSAKNTEGFYIQNKKNGIFANGINITDDYNSLNQMKDNIISFLTNLTTTENPFPYKTNIATLKTKLKNIIDKAKTDAETYVSSDEYTNNLSVPPVDLDTEAWKVAETANTLESYNIYLTEHPNGKHKTTANEKITELTPQDEITEDENNSSDEVIENNKEEEKDKTEKPDKDKIAWNLAEKENTKKAYQKYKSDFPKGNYIKNANAEIKRITKKKKEKKKINTDFILYGLIVLLLVAVGFFWYSNKKKKQIIKEREEKLKELEKKKVQNTTQVSSKQNDTIKKNVSHNTTTVISSTPTIKKEEIKKDPVFPIINGDWTIVGASVIGKSHIETGKPCQDSHYYEMIDKKWGIAVTADGAGSAKLSDIGSKVVAKMSVLVFKKVVSDNKWNLTNKLPTETQWTKIAKQGIKQIYVNLKAYAEKNNHKLTDLACTVIVNIFSPNGLLVTHIGDGRAGYRNGKAEWKSSITPHSGEESNQTIFITSTPWLADENFKMSGVSVPESRIINEKITAFVSMSDGGEAHLYESSKIDPLSKKWSDPNKPASLFEKHIETIISNKKSNSTSKELNEMWKGYIEKGTTGLTNEPDDKTVILGILA